MLRKLISRLAVVFVVVGVAGTASAQAGLASPKADHRPGIAMLQGRLIDLSEGWQNAQTCLVFSAVDTRCFTSDAEAEAFLGYSRAADLLYQSQVRAAALSGAAGVPACPSGWFCLYADTNGDGRQLQFRDEYWQYLSRWGFDRQTSSWRNAQALTDSGHLSLYNRSTVYNCPAGGYANSMGVYDNQAYAVWG